jgi:hypothetical protein
MENQPKEVQSFFEQVIVQSKDKWVKMNHLNQEASSSLF